MLGKLLKQDFRATARIILPVYAAVPVLGQIGRASCRERV